MRKAKGPQRDPGFTCPLHRADVSKVCHKCDWYIQIRGANPQTGESVDEWGCAIPFLVLIGIEGAQMSRQTGAAVESFRNEMVRQNRELVALGGGSADPGLLIGGGGRR